MIHTTFYRTREDGVDLYITVDAVVDERGNPVLDENKQPIRTGFKILQVETNTTYDEAIDVAGAPYTYTTTNEPIETKVMEGTNEL